MNDNQQSFENVKVWTNDLHRAPPATSVRIRNLHIESGSFSFPPGKLSIKSSISMKYLKNKMFIGSQVTWSTTITDPLDERWEYEDKYLLHSASRSVLSRTPEGLHISRRNVDGDPSQHWILDYNGIRDCDCGNK